MLYALWSAKGGSGTTVTAALLAATLSDPSDALLVDLAGDLPGVVGAPEPVEGLAQLSSDPVEPEVVRRVETTVSDGVSLIGCGDGELHPQALGALWDVLAADPRDVVVDAGTLEPADVAGSSARGAVATEAVRRAERSVLVVRSCYLGLRASLGMLGLLPADGCILVMETGRLLKAQDVAAVLGLPVLCQVNVTSAVARAADAGVLLERPDRPTVRALRSAA